MRGHSICVIHRSFHAFDDGSGLPGLDRGREERTRRARSCLGRLGRSQTRRGARSRFMKPRRKPSLPSNRFRGNNVSKRARFGFARPAGGSPKDDLPGPCPWIGPRGWTGRRNIGGTRPALRSGHWSGIFGPAPVAFRPVCSSCTFGCLFEPVGRLVAEPGCIRDYAAVGCLRPKSDPPGCQSGKRGNWRFGRGDPSGNVLRGVIGRETGKSIDPCSVRPLAGPRVSRRFGPIGGMAAGFGIKVLCQGDRDTEPVGLRSVSCGRPQGLGGMPRRKTGRGNLACGRCRTVSAGLKGL